MTLGPAAPKLAKLILLLGSDKSGEVTAAAAAIDRTLKASGLDLHALAKAIESGPIKTNSSGVERERVWQRKAAFCEKHSNILNDWERKFVKDMVENLKTFSFPTRKQAACLDKIYDKLVERTA